MAKEMQLQCGIMWTNGIRVIALRQWTARSAGRKGKRVEGQARTGKQGRTGKILVSLVDLKPAYRPMAF